MCSYVLVDPQERELCEPWERGSLILEAAQERVEPPSHAEVGQEGGPIETGQSETGRQSHDKTVR